MLKLGRFAVFAGIALIVVGMVIGFTLLYNGEENAIIWLGTIIPVGFVVLLTGTVTSLLSHNDDD